MKNIFRKYFYMTLFFHVLSAAAFADLYQWQDKKGGIHIVDDILLVPQQYKNKVKVLKTKPSEQAPPVREEIRTPQSSDQEELYGGYPLAWWKSEFDNKKTEILELEKTIEEQKNYTLYYERGRRLYQIYTKEDIERYETYKRELPDNEDRLKKLKTDLEEFRRKATFYGVPRGVRGE